MAPRATTWGYALPRVAIEQAGRLGQSRDQKRFFKAMDILDASVINSSSPNELLALLAEKAIENDADPIAVLGHIFAKEIPEEHGSLRPLRKIAKKIEEKAPKLWRKYKRLSPGEKDKNNIVNLL